MPESACAIQVIRILSSISHLKSARQTAGQLHAGGVPLRGSWLASIFLRA